MPIFNKKTNNMKEQNQTPIQSAFAYKVIQFYSMLLIVMSLVLWLSQSSINAYWQQTYHKPSALEKLSTYKFWLVGSSYYSSLAQEYDDYQKWFEGKSDLWLSYWSVPSNSTAPINQQKTTAGLVAGATLSKQPPTSNTVVAKEHKSIVTLKSGDKVFFAGDSLMQGVVPFVEQSLRRQYQINSINLSRQSTGLSYPSFFDWPATIEKTLAENSDIKLLVVFLGPNDPWDFPDPDKPRGATYLKFASPRWEQIYLQRVERIITAAHKAHADIIWLGIPYMKSTKLNTQMRTLDGLLSNELKEKVIWLPTEKLLSNGGSQYVDSVVLNDKAVRLRSKDGIHFSVKGQQYLANYILQHIVYQAPVKVELESSVSNIK